MNLNITNACSKPYLYSLNNQQKANTPKAVSFRGQELVTPEVTKKLQLIDNEVKKANKIAIVTHIKPDGDAAGSAAAVKNLILSKYPDKEVDVFIAGSLSNRFQCIKNSESFEYINKNSNIEAIKSRNYDLSISVDSAETKLIDKSCLEVFNSAPTKIKIDHHPAKDDYADINLTCPNASSAAQVVLLLAEHMGVKPNKELASDLYLGIVTDTAGFRYMQKPADVFEDCSKLAKTGFDTREIYCSSMDSMSKEALRFYADTLKNIKFTEDNKIAYIVDDSITEQDPSTRRKKGINTSKTFDKTGLDSDTVKDIMSKTVGIIMPNIEGVKIAAKITEEDNRMKDCFETGASLRGKGVNVSDFATENGGGGHTFAAAFKESKKTAAKIKKHAHI